jgi:hypothetical protein
MHAVLRLLKPGFAAKTDVSQKLVALNHHTGRLALL